MNPVVDDAKDRMHKAVMHLQEEFSTVRTGRATPALVEKLKVDYYGSEVPLQQLAGISVPEPRVLLVTPYDKGALGSIEKAIQASDLGVNPSNDGAVIRLNFPELTEERRKDLVKVVKGRAEDVGRAGRVGHPHPGRAHQRRLHGVARLVGEEHHVQVEALVAPRVEDARPGRIDARRALHREAVRPRRDVDAAVRRVEEGRLNVVHTTTIEDGLYDSATNYLERTF